MGKYDEKTEQLVATKEIMGERHTASVQGLRRLSPENIFNSKEIKGPKVIRVTLKDIQEIDKK